MNRNAAALTLCVGHVAGIAATLGIGAVAALYAMLLAPAAAVGIVCLSKRAFLAALLGLSSGLAIQVVPWAAQAGRFSDVEVLVAMNVLLMAAGFGVRRLACAFDSKPSF